VAKRNLEQNKLFHCYCREISEHFLAMDIKISEGMAKEIVKKKLGNTFEVEVVGEIIVMPTASYKMSEHQLTAYDHQQGFISFDQLIERMVAWCATDINLILSSPNEKDLVNHG